MPVTLPLIAYEPVTERGLYAREMVEDITDRSEGYNHTIDADGGFNQASFTIKGPESYLRDWMEDGLFRRIVKFNPEGLPSFEAYVEKLSFANGSYQKTKSLDSVVNRVYLRYSPLDVTTTTPTPAPQQTMIVDDTSSQARYGVKAVIQNGGEITDEEAYAWARLILREQAEPQEGESVNTLGTSTPALKVDVKGFYHTLKWVPYYALSTGKLHSHLVIQDVLRYFDGINPGFISTDFGLMDFNFLQTKRYYDSYPTCQKVIDDIVKFGGLAGERWVFGVYDNRTAVYKPAEDLRGLYSDSLLLTRSLRDPEQKIFEEGLETEVKPWDMRPDRILRTVDLEVG